MRRIVIRRRKGSHMLKRQTKKSFNPQHSMMLLLSFLMPLSIVTITWYFNEFYPFGDNTVMAIDFGNQYIDLFAFMRRTILESDFGALVYSFNKSMGGSTVGIWAYYLLSPFNLIYLLFPKLEIVSAAHLGIFLRYGCMSLAMAYYLSKRQSKDNANLKIVLFSTAYALCGFSVSYQMNPLFMDALIMLPLILIGLEELLDGGRPFKFIGLLAFTIFINFYMSFMICIFIVFYAIYYIMAHQWQVSESREKRFEILWKRLYPVALSGILSVGLIAFFIVPLFFNLLYSKGELNSGMRFAWELQINPLEIFSKFMIGSFDNNSWSAGPNLPNIFVSSLPLIGLILYFFEPRITKYEKFGAAGIFVIFLISIVHKFTNQLWHMGQSPAGFFYRFSWLISFFIILLAYRYFEKNNRIKTTELFFIAAVLLFVLSFVMLQDHTFLTSAQLQASAFCFALVGILLVSKHRYKWAAIAVILAAELGSNMYLSQSRMNYPSLSLFKNSIAISQEYVDKIRPDDDEFYRINPLFYRDKNDPFMQDFAGFTNFSSNLENNTRNLFYRIGSNGINAATTYNGSKITDAIFNIQYHIKDLPYTGDSDQAQYNFREDFSRPGVLTSENLIDSTDRFEIYRNPNVLPIAFGVNESVIQLELIKNQPMNNHNAIGQAIIGRDDIFLQDIEAELDSMENLEVITEDQNNFTVKRQNDYEEGVITYRFTPTTDDDYYVQLPDSIRFMDSNNNRFLLNGQRLPMISSYSETQLVNIASHAKGIEQTFSIRTEANHPIDLSQLRFARLDESLVEKLVAERQPSGLQVKHSSSNSIEGNVNITDDSSWMFTSIPYDRGWRIQVDGKSVDTREIWEGLLAFPIQSGEHQIKMVYRPVGLIAGIGISIVSIIALVVWIMYYNRHFIKAK